VAASSQADVAARLIERLLADPAFRARFRRDPAGACREAGLEELAQEMSVAGGKAMMTLDIRESKSSLAGVMMAAAMEGAAIYQFTENLLPHLDEIPGQIADVLSRVDLPAIPDGLKKPPSGGDAAPAAAVAPPADGEAAASPAVPSAPPPAAPPPPPEADAKAAEKAAEAKADAPPPPPEEAKPDKAEAAAKEAAAKIAEEDSPEAASKAAQEEAAAALEERATGLPGSSDLPDGSALPETPPENALPEAPPANALPEAPPANALPEAQPENALPSEAPPETPPAAAPAQAAAVAEVPEVKRAAINPAQFGGEEVGTGGAPDPEALALLNNKNVVLDDVGIADIKAGRIDPRVVAVLTKLSQEHEIKVSCMCSDHSKLTAGGSISNHFYGRGLDIAAIDGEIVNPGSTVARQVASELSSLDPNYRPNEIGSPWAIGGPGYFTDAAHQDHLHIGFKEQITADWKPPADVAAAGTPEAAGAPAAVAPVVAPVAGAPVVAGTPVAPVEPAPPPKQESQLFLKAVTAEAAPKQKPSESQLFLKAVEPPKPTEPAAPVPGAPVDLAAAAPDAYPGDNAPKEQIAAWMAGQAEKRGLPPELPLMAALVESGLENLNHGHADSVGFFQMRVGIWNQGEYAGYPEKPELQVKWFLDTAEQVKKQRLAAGKPIDDPNSYGEWIADVERPAEQYRYRYQEKLAEAKDLLSRRPAVAPAPAGVVDVAAAVAPAGGGGNSLGAAALAHAETQQGVKETGGANRGAEVEEYLASAKVAPGNPWCASFITWSLEQAGHKMPGGGWAAVQTWVRSAEQGNNGLQIVSAEDARPGDIVAYDWGGQNDFGADGHIGFLKSDVKDGKFTALEGNNNDRVGDVPRSTSGANVVFIRVNGDAPAGAAPPVDPAAAGAPPAAASQPIDPKQFGGEGTGTGGPPNAEALALLNNKNIVLDSTGIADIKAGRIDPRVIGVLTKLSQEHKITVSCMCSDHSKFTAGGSVSNHFFGRGVDIAAIDGETVGPGSAIAREVASELSSLDPNIRPNEIGSPWAISGPGYFTDAAHQNHLHLGFKEEITPDWKPPADVAATAAVAPGTPVAAVAQAPPPPQSSQLFLKAVTAEAAEAASKKKPSESQLFLKAVEATKPAAAAPVDPAAAPVPGAGAAVDAAALAAAAPDAYPGDNAPKEQIAAWMAGQAQKRGLPPQLPLMAALVESGLENLNHGHADSVGFFQMRVGIWNQGAYAGYPEKPELQVKWFLDQAEAVKKQRLVAGKPIDDPNSFGEWIADVERPAEQYRGRYQTKLEEANQLLASSPQQPVAAAPVDPAAAAASAAAVGNAKLPPEILGPVQDAIAAGNAPGPKALAAIEEASKHLGTDYVWGGSTPQTGFDCSGLMQWSYAQSGVQIPRVTYTQVEAPNGTEVADRSSLKPGDLVFFSSGGDVHHVGMYLGDQKFLHAPSTGDVVKVSSLDEPYYAGQFAGGRRFDEGAPVAAAPVAAAAAPVAPAVDPTAVAQAQAAVARDAAEVRRQDSALFLAVKAEETTKETEKRRSALFLKAVDPSQVKRPEEPVAAAAAAPVAPVAPPPPEAAPVAPAAPVEAVAAASIDLTNAATDYPGDNASQEELAKWLAKQAEKAGLPPELPVMAALVESGVKNLNHGDADSVGFFQMRVGIWNKGEYAGYPEKPELQAKWFIDTALEVKRNAIAKGNADFGKDPAEWGEWIADTERPAEQYRHRYQLRLNEARKLLSA
jgi:putative modified peptide